MNLASLESFRGWVASLLTGQRFSLRRIFRVGQLPDVLSLDDTMGVIGG